MRLLALAAIALLFAGCSGPAADAPADAATDDVAPLTDLEEATEAIHFDGSDHAFLCPPVGGLCVMSGSMPTKTFAVELGAGDIMAGLDVELSAIGAAVDQRVFRFQAICSTTDGEDGCAASDLVIAEAEGSLPLRLQASDVAASPGGRILFYVTGDETVDGVTNVPMDYMLHGDLHLLRASA